MQFWVIQTLNSFSLGGLLFLLSAGFALIFGLMRVANLMHGSLFMLGAYIAATCVRHDLNLVVAVLIAGVSVAVVGGVLERAILRRIAGNSQGQVLATLGLSFIIADLCLVTWGGDPIPIDTPQLFKQSIRLFGFAFPAYRVVVVVVACLVFGGLYWLLERTRLGAMIRASVDDMPMARASGIRASALFTIVFALGALLAGAGGAIGGPIFSAYPGLDGDMLPLALIVVILGGVGSLFGTFVSSFIVGFTYTFGNALLPDLSYVILFLPMVVVIAFRPAGLFGTIKTS
jgi:branched-chain amino acid transport system permease protein